MGASVLPGDKASVTSAHSSSVSAWLGGISLRVTQRSSPASLHRLLQPYAHRMISFLPRALPLFPPAEPQYFLSLLLLCLSFLCRYRGAEAGTCTWGGGC